MSAPPQDIAGLAEGVRAGDRRALARAITLVESRREDDSAATDDLLVRLLPRTGTAFRVGISGSPGAGKSTLIDALGMMLVKRGHRVAVLAVDPSSTVSGGSILGDKARMGQLASQDAAFIRPSPSASTLGGVTRRTRESLLLCEAAGFDVVLVETVGVGQSETAVADMVDFFLLLVIPGGGDELQGIKKGIVEAADLIAVNKADGDLLPAARIALAEYSAALRYLRARTPSWTPAAQLLSARTGDGIEALWDAVVRHREALEASGELASLRREQRVRWMWSLVHERLIREFRALTLVRDAVAASEAAVRAGSRMPSQAADDLLRAWRESGPDAP
jgi:GTPase